MPPEVPLLYRIVLDILSFLFFHIKLIIVLSSSVMNFVGILMGIALNLQIAFGRIAIFTMFPELALSRTPLMSILNITIEALSCDG